MERETTKRMRLSDALFTTIRSAVETDPRHEKRVALYTTFGIVRGRVSADTISGANRMNDARLENTARVILDPDLIELGDATVEHYSNHLPSAMFQTLYVRIADVHGFAVEDTSY